MVDFGASIGTVEVKKSTLGAPANVGFSSFFGSSFFSSTYKRNRKWRMAEIRQQQQQKLKHFIAPMRVARNFIETNNERDQARR